MLFLKQGWLVDNSVHDFFYSLSIFEKFVVMDQVFQYKEANIYYSDQGKGQTVVFLHGFLCSSKIWKDYAQELKKRYRVIIPDLPGHGKSDSIGYLHSMELMADCIFELLRNLKIRKAQYIGHSMGGYIALAILEKYPDNCKSVTLFNSTASDDPEEKKTDRSRAIEVIKKNYKLYISQVVPNLFYTEKKPLKRQISNLMQIAKEASKKGVIACQEGMKLRSNREIVVRFSACPIHYIIGKKDTILKYQDIINQTEGQEQVSYYLSEDGGHMCMYEDKEAVFQSLSSFLKKN